MFALTLTLVCSSLIAAPELTPAPATPPKHGGVYVVAHRGAHQGIPENTLAAYKRAIDLGADYVEIDVRTTRDDQYVSVHNREVDAYAQDRKGLVEDLTLAELKALDIGSRIGPEWKDERIPTFEEILDLCKGKIGIYLDLKEAPIPPLVERIKARGMERDVLWYIDADAIPGLLDLCPECIPMPDPGPESFLEELIEGSRPGAIASVWKFYSKSFVEACHNAGAIVIVDESTPECWEDAIAWGSDGIQTDHPEDLIRFLDERAEK